MVERYELAPGLTISRVLTGLWQVADMERDGRTLALEAAARAMAAYLEAGLTSFDMADHYGSAETIAGYFRRHYDPEGRAQLLTKWVPPPGPTSRAEVRAAVERALGHLQLEALPLLQYHAWTFADPVWLDCLGWLDELRREGLIRYLGVTNFDTAHLQVALASGFELVSNQVCYSLLDRRPSQGLAALCHCYGVKLLAYGTLAGGLLSERWLDKPEPVPTTYSQMKYNRFIAASGGWAVFQQLLATVAAIARRHGVSIANVAARYVLEQPEVAGVIIGARLTEREHIADTLRLFDLALTDEDYAQLEAALAALTPIPGDSGDEYRKPPFLTASGDLSHHFERLVPPYPVELRPDGRQLVSTGTVWEELAGYSRAVRQGDRIFVSGTTATHRDRPVGGDDAAAQLHVIIDKLEGVLQSLGSRLEDVVRTRIYLKRLEDWEAVARAHGARFGNIRPANTLVQANLVGDYLVELEAEAVVTT